MTCREQRSAPIGALSTHPKPSSACSANLPSRAGASRCVSLMRSAPAASGAGPRPQQKSRWGGGSRDGDFLDSHQGGMAHVGFVYQDQSHTDHRCFRLKPSACCSPPSSAAGCCAAHAVPGAGARQHAVPGHPGGLASCEELTAPWDTDWCRANPATHPLLIPPLPCWLTPTCLHFVRVAMPVRPWLTGRGWCGRRSSR